ncbi:hypothetical protein PR048_007091 [Dryococelus australis]|uniref:Uncharacterized protein n=1 Tax=Dryococelus australis TaxID=614101 RepID=A0ABQ9ICM8_9NEOP|nr:hypothetical protein PR048_007091 [Dryococelus australis]
MLQYACVLVLPRTNTSGPTPKASRCTIVHARIPAHLSAMDSAVTRDYVPPRLGPPFFKFQRLMNIGCSRYGTTFHPLLPTGFDPRPCHSGILQVGIVADDAVGRRVFSGISRFPPPLHSSATPCSLRSPTSALKTSMLTEPPKSFTRYLSLYLEASMVGYCRCRIVVSSVSRDEAQAAAALFALGNSSHLAARSRVFSHNGFAELESCMRLARRGVRSLARVQTKTLAQPAGRQAAEAYENTGASWGTDKPPDSRSGGPRFVSRSDHFHFGFSWFSEIIPDESLDDSSVQEVVADSLPGLRKNLTQCRPILVKKPSRNTEIVYMLARASQSNLVILIRPHMIDELQLHTRQQDGVAGLQRVTRTCVGGTRGGSNTALKTGVTSMWSREAALSGAAPPTDLTNLWSQPAVTAARIFFIRLCLTFNATPLQVIQEPYIYAGKLCSALGPTFICAGLGRVHRIPKTGLPLVIPGVNAWPAPISDCVQLAPIVWPASSPADYASDMISSLTVAMKLCRYRQSITRPPRAHQQTSSAARTDCMGAEVAERLACSPPTNANHQVQFPYPATPGF